MSRGIKIPIYLDGDINTNDSLSGTGSVDAPLRLSGTFTPSIDSATAYQWFKADGTTDVMTIDSDNERVGIGISSPDAKLHIYDNDPYIRLTDAAAPTAHGQIMSTNHGGLVLAADYGNNVDNSYFAVTVDSTERMRISSSGRVGIGTSSPNENAILDVTSTTKAFLPPRMTTTQRDAIPSPAAGMVVYNTTTSSLNVYTTSWENVAQESTIPTSYSTYRSSKDGNEIFTVITYKRSDGTTYMVSTLSGGTSPEYTTRTVQYYDTDGTTLLKTETYTLSYDVDGNLESEVLD